MPVKCVKLAVVSAVCVFQSLALTGCGDDKPPARQEGRGGHVWKGMTDTIPTARDAARDVNSAQGAQEAAIERARRGD
jgi:hypothetical protein